MTKKQRNYFFLGSIVSVFVMAAALLFGTGKISLSPLNVRGSTEIVEGTVTWNKDSSYTQHGSGRRTYYTSTSRGTGIYMYSYGRWTPSGSAIFDSTRQNDSYGVYITTEQQSTTSLFSFQYIKAVTITTGSYTTVSSSNGVKLYVNGLEGDPYVKTGLSSSTSYRITEIEGGTSLAILLAHESYEVDINSITIEYSCIPGGIPAVKSLSSISLSGPTTVFTVGDAFSFGGTVTAHYTDFTTSNVTASSTFTGYDMSTAGEYTVTVSYTEGTTETASYTITVNENDGTRYNYSKRKYSGATYDEQYIIFKDNGVLEWHLIRLNAVDLVDPSKTRNYHSICYFDYTLTLSSGSYNISLTLTSYDLYADKANSWSGTTVDRPVRSFVANPATNTTGVMDSKKTSFTIGVYQSGSSLVYDTFTFNIAS